MNRSPIAKRSIVLNGHKTSISLEQLFWDALHEHARLKKLTLSALVMSIDLERKDSNLSSAIRCFLFRYHYSPTVQR